MGGHLAHHPLRPGQPRHQPRVRGQVGTLLPRAVLPFSATVVHAVPCCREDYGMDQTLLELYVWHHWASRDALLHDSYRSATSDHRCLYILISV